MFNGFPKREGRYEISHNLNRGDFHSRVTRGVTLREVRESSGSAVLQVSNVSRDIGTHGCETHLKCKPDLWASM